MLLVVPPSGALTTTDWHAFLDRVSAYNERGQKFCLLFDTRGAPLISADVRRMIAERMDKDANKYPTLLCGLAVVTTNSVQRGVMNVIAWLVRKSCPIEGFADVETAVQWCRKRIVARSRETRLAP